MIKVNLHCIHQFYPFEIYSLQELAPIIKDVNRTLTVKIRHVGKCVGLRQKRNYLEDLSEDVCEQEKNTHILGN